MTPDVGTTLAGPHAVRGTTHAPPRHAPRVEPVRSRSTSWSWIARRIDESHRCSRSAFVLVIDLALVAVSAYVAGLGPQGVAVFAIAVIFALYMSGIYRERSCLETQGVLWFISAVVNPIAMTTLGALAVANAAGWPIRAILLAGGAGFVALCALRSLSWSVLVIERRRGGGMRRTLIVGDSDKARMLARKLGEFPEAGLLPIAILPLGNGYRYNGSTGYFPTGRELAGSIIESLAEHVVLVPDGTEDAILACIRGSDRLDVSFSILPPLSEVFLHPAMVAQVGGVPLIPLGKIAKRRTTLPGKRIFDIAGATLLLIGLSPVMLLTAAAIKISDHGPVFYRQRRVGRQGKMFSMLKFRSMIPGAERLVIDLTDRNANDGLLFKVTDDPRVTTVGQTIRRLSIDELPQLINVIRGEMSLVGPRPLPVRPDDFNEIDAQRHQVLPGITGYWQIAGAHGLCYEEMVKLDLAYIQNWSLWTDVRILLRTIPALLHRRGPY